MAGALHRILPALRTIRFQSNRRLLAVQTVSHDCAIGEDAFDQMAHPLELRGQRASALRFGDSRTQALRTHLAGLLGVDPDRNPAGRMSYDLRRLRLQGLTQRIAKTHRYELTAQGLRIAMFFCRTYDRLLRPGLAQIIDASVQVSSPLRTAFDRRHAQIDQRCEELQLAA